MKPRGKWFGGEAKKGVREKKSRARGYRHSLTKESLPKQENREKAKDNDREGVESLKWGKRLPLCVIGGTPRGYYRGKVIHLK